MTNPTCSTPPKAGNRRSLFPSRFTTDILGFGQRSSASTPLVTPSATSSTPTNASIPRAQTWNGPRYRVVAQSAPDSSQLVLRIEDPALPPDVGGSESFVFEGVRSATPSQAQFAGLGDAFAVTFPAIALGSHEVLLFFRDVLDPTRWCRARRSLTGVEVRLVSGKQFVSAEVLSELGDRTSFSWSALSQSWEAKTFSGAPPRSGSSSLRCHKRLKKPKIGEPTAETFTGRPFCVAAA